MNNEINCIETWCKSVKIALIREDLSLKDLAELTGYSPSYVRAVISGRLLRIDNIRQKINEVLNIDE